MTELTIEQACQHPADFLYIWASDEKFLPYIPKKFADIIKGKRANQRKILALSAEKYGTTQKAYEDAIYQAFIDIWEHTPAEALVILAQGGEIAGKNWEEGIFGIGAVQTFSNNPKILVDAKNGHIFNNGADITDTSKTIYSTVKGQVFPVQYAAQLDGVTYMSKYNKITKKYAAYTWSNAEGTFSANSGSAVSSSQSSDIWAAVIQSLDKFINWLLQLFTGSSVETITAENTLPSQTGDGFVSKEEGGFAEAGGILLALAAGTALLASGGINVGGRKARK